MTSRVFTYSQNNIYANDYYNACKKFDNIRAKVLNYENKCDDRESLKYQNLIEEFRFWDKQVPETSNIAGAYEKKLLQQKEGNNEQNVLNSQKIGLNYLA